MADDMRGRGVGSCDERCGCPSPCPGGIACRCSTASGGGGDDPAMVHKQCSCGEHCGCNPCTCSKTTEIRGTGKGFCKCGAACTCPTCAAA